MGCGASKAPAPETFEEKLARMGRQFADDHPSQTTPSPTKPRPAPAASPASALAAPSWEQRLRAKGFTDGDEEPPGQQEGEHQLRGRQRKARRASAPTLESPKPRRRSSGGEPATEKLDRGGQRRRSSESKQQKHTRRRSLQERGSEKEPPPPRRRRSSIKESTNAHILATVHQRRLSAEALSRADADADGGQRNGGERSVRRRSAAEVAAQEAELNASLARRRCSLPTTSSGEIRAALKVRYRPESTRVCLLLAAR